MSHFQAHHEPHSHRADSSIEFLRERICDERETKALTGNLSRAQRYRMMKAGAFPARVQLSPGRGGWRLGDLLDWLQAR